MDKIGLIKQSQNLFPVDSFNTKTALKSQDKINKTIKSKFVSL